MLNKTILLAILTNLIACSALSNDETPQNIVNQLTGTWYNKNHDGKVIFYADKTAKIVFLKRQPPIKLISTYETIKGDRIGINLSGSWSGPAFINTSKLAQAQLSIAFPDEAPTLLVKAKP